MARHKVLVTMLDYFEVIVEADSDDHDGAVDAAVAAVDEMLGELRFLVQSDLKLFEWDSVIDEDEDKSKEDER